MTTTWENTYDAYKNMIIKTCFKKLCPSQKKKKKTRIKCIKMSYYEIMYNFYLFAKSLTILFI